MIFQLFGEYKTHFLPRNNKTLIMKTVILYFIIYLTLLNTSLEKLGSTVSDKINDYVT